MAKRTAINIPAQHRERALAICRATDDKPAQARILSNLGAVYSDIGEMLNAIPYFEQALTLYREMGDKPMLLKTVSSLWDAHLWMGWDSKITLKFYEEVLAISREIGDKSREGELLGQLGQIFYASGKTERALDYYQQSITVRRTIGDQMGEAEILYTMGIMWDDQSDYPQALACFEQAFTIYTTIDAAEMLERTRRWIAKVQTKISAKSNDTQDHR